ncbi:unnamed protein product [Brachionus calyciflorus]|uniref:Uncharacterized protein n=1 Tax=Brachionus calyciflorus TaxID=104777 RepID=A0A813N5J0_9BILA|nr:unnamed protein product [Brachionus calyciflorus]
MKINSNLFILVLLSFFIINNVESGPVLGGIALVGCKAAFASCIIGTTGVGVPLCYIAYYSCTALAMSTVVTPTP